MFYEMSQSSVCTTAYYVYVYVCLCRHCVSSYLIKKKKRKNYKKNNIYRLLLLSPFYIFYDNVVVVAQTCYVRIPCMHCRYITR